MAKRNTQWRRRLEVDRIRREARTYARDHLDDPFFVAGVVLYWAEGGKIGRRLEMSATSIRPRGVANLPPGR